MQFMLVRQNGPDKFKAWERDFEDVYEFIESVRAPRYPGKIDWQLADAASKPLTLTAPAAMALAQKRKQLT